MIIKKIIIIFIIAILIVTMPANASVSAFQQGQEILNQWGQIPDSVKVKKLSDLCWQNRGGDPEKALLYGNLALQLAEKTGMNVEIAQLYNYIGVIYRNRGNYSLALEYYNKALKQAESVNSKTQIAYSYNNLGGIYRLQGKYAEALSNIYKAMDYFRALGNERGLAFCKINVALIFKKQMDYNKAQQLLNEIVETRKKLGDKQGEAVAKSHIAEIDYELGKYLKALNVYNSLINLFEEIDDKKGVLSCYNGIGSIYFKLKDYKLSLIYRMKALDLTKLIDNKVGMIISYRDIGMVYLKLGRLDTAEKYLKDALKLARRIEDTDEILASYKKLSEFYESTSKSELALKYFKSYNALHDSVFSRESLEKITMLTRDYEMAKSLHENKALRAEAQKSETQRDYTIAILLVIILVIIVLYINNQKIHNINKKLKEANAAKDSFFRIIAHDVKNPFQTILSFSEFLKDDVDDLSHDEIKNFSNDINSSAKHVYELFENLLEWGKAQSGKLDFKPEIVNLKEIVSETVHLFSETAKSKNIEIVSKVDDEISVTADKQMLKTVFRNLINNGIKFTEPFGKITITVKKEADEVKISVADTGVGIAEENLKKLFDFNEGYRTRGTQDEKGSGLGLILCREFIERHGGKLEVKSSVGKGSVFSFALPNEHKTGAVSKSEVVVE